MFVDLYYRGQEEPDVNKTNFRIAGKRFVDYEYFIESNWLMNIYTLLLIFIVFSFLLEVIGESLILNSDRPCREIMCY